jgi:hypothetical protein
LAPLCANSAHAEECKLLIASGEIVVERRSETHVVLHLARGNEP